MYFQIKMFTRLGTCLFLSQHTCDTVTNDVNYFALACWMWANGAILNHTSWSALVQTMACCLIKLYQKHYLNLCWSLISEMVETPKGTFTHGPAEAGGKLASTQIITCVHTCAEREQNPLRKKWVQHPIFHVRFQTARSKPSLSSRNGRSARVHSAYVWTYPR